VQSIVDDYSRLAYSEIDDDEKASAVTTFTQRALVVSPGSCSAPAWPRQCAT